MPSGLLVSTMSVYPLLQCAQAEGLAVPSLLAGSGLTEARLRDPAGQVAFAQELVVTGNYLALTRERHPGLRASGYYHFNAFGVLGAALVSHADLLEAVRFLVRYVGLTFTPFLVQVEEDGAEFRARYLDRGNLGACHGFYLLRDLAFVRNLCREAAPATWCTLVTGMDIAMTAPADAAAVQEFFGWPLRFGAEETVIHADPTCLRQPLRFANPLTLQLMQAQCDEQLARQQPPSWRERVEALLLAAPASGDAASVARGLCCSERSLRRYLQQEGCAFHEVVAALQRRRAERYLAHSRLSVESIAYRLGYSETAAFTHAFKRWTGRTPSQFREVVGEAGGT